jgi:hypothetical protein
MLIEEQWNSRVLTEEPVSYLDALYINILGLSGLLGRHDDASKLSRGILS